MTNGQSDPRADNSLSSLGGTERDRAEKAWGIASGVKKESWFDQYRNLVKGSASLVMSNGLISALAYYTTRSGATKDAAKRLAEDIAKFALSGIYDPVDALEKLVKLDSSHYMLATSEVLANLRWLRQFVDTVRD